MLGGCLLCLQALTPLLKSWWCLGPISKSFRSVHSSKIFLSLIACAACSGHWRMCASVSGSVPHHGHAANWCFPHQCIILPVAQKPVVNFVVHLHWVIIMLVTTLWMVCQSMDSMSIPQKCDFPAQYCWARFLLVWYSSFLFTSMLTFLLFIPMVLPVNC